MGYTSLARHPPGGEDDVRSSFDGVRESCVDSRRRELVKGTPTYDEVVLYSTDASPT